MPPGDQLHRLQDATRGAALRIQVSSPSAGPLPALTPAAQRTHPKTDKATAGQLPGREHFRRNTILWWTPFPVTHVPNQASPSKQVSPAHAQCKLLGVRCGAANGTAGREGAGAQGGQRKGTGKRVGQARTLGARVYAAGQHGSGNEKMTRPRRAAHAAWHEMFACVAAAQCNGQPRDGPGVDQPCRMGLAALHNLS